MFARFERHRRRLSVCVVIGRKIERKVRQDRLGYLGSVAYSEPISLAERVRFWAGINQRFLALRARHPGISEADEVKIRDQVAERIPRASTAEERRLFLQATILRDVMAAVDRLEHVEDALAEAAKRLKALARQERPVKPKTPSQAET
jgi:hypothetical protein